MKYLEITKYVKLHWTLKTTNHRLQNWEKTKINARGLGDSKLLGCHFFLNFL